MFKTKLNEFCHQSGFLPPIYLVGDPVGPPHNPTFVECTVAVGEKKFDFRSKASSKKELENLAAEETLKLLENEIITNTEKMVSRSAKTKKHYDKVYLIDYDNCSWLDLQNLNGELKIFAPYNNITDDKLKVLRGRPNVEIHKSEVPLICVVHMMIWYACENLLKIMDKEVIIVAADQNSYSLASILIRKGVKAKISSI